MTQNTNTWLQERKSGIGGSDAAAVLGLSKYRTPYQVYEDKIGEAEPITDNAYMFWGRTLEPIIREQYANRTGRIIETPNRILRHPEYDFIIANVDGLTNDGRVLEIKTARMNNQWGEEGTDQIPTEYILQAQHYMLVTGRSIADIAVLISGSDYRQYEIAADKELHEMMIEQYIDFWEHVKTHTPPEPINYEDALSRYGRQSVDNKVTASADNEKAICRLQEIKEVISTLEDEEKELKASIMMSLGDNDTLVDIQGNALCTWKASKPTNRFDSKSFEKDHPELYATYLKQSEPTRRFLLK